MPKRSGEGAYREHQEKLWRHDKKRPRRLRVEVNEDYGRSRHKTLVTFPKGVTVERKEIPKQRSGNWKQIWNQGIKIRKSLTTNRIYMFTPNDEYLGELEGYESYHLAIKLLQNIGAFREEVHKSRKGYVWIVHTLKSFNSFKREHST